MSNYRVGDWVRIRADLREGHAYGVYCNSDMARFALGVKFKGKLLQNVKALGGYVGDAFQIEGDEGRWIFTPDMFECKLYGEDIDPVERRIAIKTFCQNCKVKKTCAINKRNKTKGNDIEACEAVESGLKLAMKLGSKEFPYKNPSLRNKKGDINV